MRPFYRVWQFWQVVTARPLDEEAQVAIAAVLSAEQMGLFGRFSVSEQQHSYRVFAALRQAGQDDPDLLAAALLHDVGKTKMPRRWWYRPVVVLGQAFLAKRAAAWSRLEDRWYARPFFIKANHAEWGAALAETAESSALTIELIRRHHDVVREGVDGQTALLLGLLQGADERS